MKHRITITTIATSLLILSSALTGTTAWAQPVSESFEMSVVLDRAYGDVVSRGKYERAILRINNRSNRFPFAAATNLCVAHTMVGQYRHAEHYCDLAIEEAERAAENGHQKNRDYTSEWAMAYSNRGVLRARIGNIPGAEEDFRMAIEKQSGTELPLHNLAVLRHENLESLAQDSDPDSLELQ